MHDNFQLLGVVRAAGMSNYLVGVLPNWARRVKKMLVTGYTRELCVRHSDGATKPSLAVIER